MSLCRIVDCSREDYRKVLAVRKAGPDDSVKRVVEEIIEDVRLHGDEALMRSARRFDSPQVQCIPVEQERIERAAVPERWEKAIRQSIANVEAFHATQKEVLTRGLSPGAVGLFRWKTDLPGGGSVGQLLRPLSSAGVYVPGGKAVYPSSVIMNALPAIVAGVTNIWIASPAGSDGDLSAPVLFAMQAIGRIRGAYRIGGAAAIAAFAFGTETVSRVDKVVGPGNRFVNEAKRQLWGQVGLDMFAGPSEVCVLIDDVARARWAAVDWLTQIEHSEDNAGFVVASGEDVANAVLKEAETLIDTAPRAAIIRAALKDHGAIFVAQEAALALEIVDRIAPEHLSVAWTDGGRMVDAFVNAGCILLGEFTPESAGDFAAGPSHTLPTATSARFASPLNVLDFMKLQSVINLTKADLADVSESIQVFGEMEGFPMHAYGAKVRTDG